MFDSLTKLCLVSMACFSTIFAQTHHNPSQEFHWTYEDIKSWNEHFPSCGGEHQSPINLNLATSMMINYPKFAFHNYDKLSREMVTNNGHTVMMSFNQSGDDLPYLTGGGLTDRYNFVQLHFHWGLDSMRGSEHHINFRPYSAELHMVHFNTKYGNFSEATKYPDGLAVLAIMIELEARDNIAFRHLEQFEEIIDPNTGKSSFLTIPVPLSDLLPDDTSSFFRYNGSLTTPRCNEDVIWTIFDTPIAISERQLNKFRELRTEEGHPLENNFRPIQELHNRIVTYRPSDTTISEFLYYFQRK